MHFRIASVVVPLACLILTASSSLALADTDAPTIGTAAPVDIASAADQPPAAPTLFLTMLSPVEQDVEVPLESTQLTVEGVTLAGAVVSIDANLVDTDDQGEFVGVTALDEGANEIDVVASDDQGNQVRTSIFVTRGE